MVDREKVISDLEEQIAWIRDNDFHKFPGWGHAVLAMRDAIALLKAQEPLACWVEEPDRENHWHCSNCGKVQGITSVAMKYCPECGSKMIEHPWAASGCGQAFSPD